MATNWNKESFTWALQVFHNIIATHDLFYKHKQTAHLLQGKIFEFSALSWICQWPSLFDMIKIFIMSKRKDVGMVITYNAFFSLLIMPIKGHNRRHASYKSNFHRNTLNSFFWETKGEKLHEDTIRPTVLAI